jgi:predicted dehydrogenase
MSHRNRRQFLEDSMFAAAAAGVGVSDPFWSVDERAIRSPNERLSVAVLGLRGRGNTHIGTLAGRGDTLITYVCDPDRLLGQRRASEVAKRQAGRTPRYVSDLRRVMDDPSVDIVSIATPHHWHALAAIWSMQAGKDVYVEKPVSHNIREGRTMVQTARRYGRICQAGTQCRSHQGMIAAMDFLHGGGIGALKSVRAICYRRRRPIGPREHFPTPQDVDYNLWLGPAKMQPVARQQFHHDWHWQWPYGNGELGYQGVHQLDLARWGMDPHTAFRGAVSFGGRFGFDDAGETANTQVVLFDCDGPSLQFELRSLKTADQRGTRIGVIFEGALGYLVLSGFSGGAAFDLDGRQLIAFRGGGDHFRNFIHAVRSRHVQDLNADIEQGHLSSALCHLGNIAYRLGSEVSPAAARSQLSSLPNGGEAAASLDELLKHLHANNIDPAHEKLRLGMALQYDWTRETFVGDPRANRLLTRSYRAPFVVPVEG